MAKNKVSVPKTAAEKAFGFKRIVLLAALLASLAFLILEAVDRAHTVHLHKAFDILFWVMWAVLEANAVMHLVKTVREKGFDHYLKFNKAELIYIVLSPIAQVISIAAPSLAWVRWVIIFGMPCVLRLFNDEKVFQVFATIVAVSLVLFFVVPMRKTWPFEIPLSAMIPVRLKNLIPACKIITTRQTGGIHKG